MKKTTLFFVMTMLLSTSIFSQSKDLLKQVSEKMASYETIKASFSYTMKNKKSGINETQNGTLRVKKTKYFLEIAGQQIYCDGVISWSVLPDAKEVQINAVADMGENALTPDKLFSDYYNRFKLKSYDEKKFDGKASYFMELTPNDKNFEFSKVTLIIEKSTLNPKELQLSDKKGSLYIYSLKNLVINEPMNDDSFRFDTKKHADYEIIDMR